MTISTAYPPITLLRRTLERHILALYESDGTSLKPATQWPGRYLLPNGNQIPAVYVVGSEMVPSAWRIEGIECVLDEVPTEIDSPGSASGLIQFERWAIRFTNYGTTEGTRMPTSMLDIRRRLARAFPRDRVTYTPRTESTFEAITAQISGAVLNPPIP
jgi:hypothetical protein